MEMSLSLQIILSVIVAFLAVNWAYFKILRIAKDKDLVDNPNARKLQKSPVPILGGIAVFFGIVAGLFVGAVFMKNFNSSDLAVIFPILLAMLVMLYTGAMDDVVGLTPRSRFVMEILSLVALVYATGSCVDSLHGLWGVESFSWWVGVPLTIFAGVGIINAVNMIDGVNGLSSGLCIVYSLFYGFVFFNLGDTHNSMLAFTTAAALLPFLLHNVFGQTSRMFIGDAGTMVMGILVTWFTISVLNSESGAASMLVINGTEANKIAVALAILSVPVFDTIRVMFIRIIHRKSPFHPDKSHLHHVFVNIGISHSITALVEIGINLIVIGICALAVNFGASNNLQLYIVVAASMFFVWGIYFFLHQHAVRHTDFMHRIAHFSISTHLGHKKWWLKIQRVLDRGEMKAIDQPAEKPEKKTTYRVKFDDSPANFKDKDRRKVLEFIVGKAEVYVSDIKQRSGAEGLRVDAIITEGVLDGYIKVITWTERGTPAIVALADDVVF